MKISNDWWCHVLIMLNRRLGDRLDEFRFYVYFFFFFLDDFWLICGIAVGIWMSDTFCFWFRFFYDDFDVKYDIWVISKKLFHGWFKLISLYCLWCYPLSRGNFLILHASSWIFWYKLIMLGFLSIFYLSLFVLLWCYWYGIYIFI